MKFKKGQSVLLTDQIPHQLVVVQDCSIWKQQGGFSDQPCYLVKSKDWKYPSWVPETSLSQA